MGKKSAKNLVNAINMRRKIELERLIFALGIRQVGISTARLLAQTYKTLEVLQQNCIYAQNINHPSYQELVDIDQIGESIANDLIIFFKKEENQRLVSSLLKSITPIIPEIANLKSSISDKVIVFTSCVFGSLAISGSIKKLTGISTTSPLSNVCSSKQKQSILEKYLPIFGGVTLNVAIPVIFDSDKFFAV